MQRLVAHSWADGNIRALRNTLERAAKNHREAELLVATDLEFLAGETTVAVPVGRPTEVPVTPELVPSDYDELFGSWSNLQRSTALHLCKQLVAALAATARRTAEDGSIHANLAGAVSCLLGRKATTLEAADLVKRIVRFDEGVAAEVAARETLFAEALRKTHRTRPRPVSRNTRKVIRP